ncbi:hypothetical protein [Kitasatospora sp. NPDC090091]|uniref:hypothetical protein n=1 Tax=Kitasatospora sp. NPDC090091 TaxID=3364081 RepID=UPI0037FA6D64
MAVILPNRRFTAHVAPHPWARDAHGLPVPPPPGSVSATGAVLPGAAVQQTDGSWSLRADPQQWPLRPGDRLVDGDESWTVTSARLCAVPVDGAADYIAVTATLDPPQVP